MHTNILTVLDNATAEQRESGLTWYENAHQIAAESGDVRMGAGIIAALSPMMSWDRNVALARRTWTDGKASGALGRNVAKADSILNGADPLDVLGGLKVRSFFLNILDPSDPTPVTIDRHAYDIALGERNTENDRPSLSNKRYAHLSDQYRLAAAEVGLVPNQVQAITWEAWRSRWAWRKVAAV